MTSNPRSRAVALAFAILMVAPALSGCLGFGQDALVVAASAPKASSGMTLFVVTDGGMREKLTSTKAEYAIYYGDRLIYPPGGKGAEFPVNERKGTVFVPYSQFVVGNGEYDVLVRYEGTESRVRVTVQKWAEYVFLHPFERGSVVEVESALSSATGGNPGDRILAKGELLLALHYRGLDGSEDRTLGSFKMETRHDQTSARVIVSKSSFTAGPGYYSFEPVFHNSEARNNIQVGADPTMANRNPPWNWIHITR